MKRDAKVIVVAEVIFSLAFPFAVSDSERCESLHTPKDSRCTGCPPRYKNGQLCASTTRYNDQTKAACGCGQSDPVPSNFWTMRNYTAALNCINLDDDHPYLSWCPSGCGGCYKLCSTGGTINGGNTTAGVCRTFKITNRCGDGYKEFPMWCSGEMSYQNCSENPSDCRKAKNTNWYGYPAHFDLQDFHLQISHDLQWDNVEVTFEKVPCDESDWRGDDWNCHCPAEGTPEAIQRQKMIKMRGLPVFAPPAVTMVPGKGNCSTQYQQCGGQFWTGPTCCAPGCSCKSRTGDDQDYYKQCEPKTGRTCAAYAEEKAASKTSVGSVTPVGVSSSGIRPIASTGAAAVLPSLSASVSASAGATSAASASGNRCAETFAQCGGKNWKGPTCCNPGCHCKSWGSKFYRQCVPLHKGQHCSSGSNAAATEVVQVAPQAAEGHWGNVGDISCSVGQISDWSMCQSVAAVVGRTFSMTEHVSDFPTGCYLSVTTQKVYFNGHPSGNSNANAKPLCQAATTPSPTAGQLFEGLPTQQPQLEGWETPTPTSIAVTTKINTNPHVEYALLYQDAMCTTDQLYRHWNIATQTACEDACTATPSCVYVSWGFNSIYNKNDCAGFASCTSTIEDPGHPSIYRRVVSATPSVAPSMAPTAPGLSLAPRTAACAPAYHKCGAANAPGPTCCEDGCYCVGQASDYGSSFDQCVPWDYGRTCSALPASMGGQALSADGSTAPQSTSAATSYFRQFGFSKGWNLQSFSVQKTSNFAGWWPSVCMLSFIVCTGLVVARWRRRTLVPFASATVSSYSHLIETEAGRSLVESRRSET